MFSNDGGFCGIDRKSIRRVMHDRAIVIGANILPVSCLLIEIVEHRRLDVRRDNRDEIVSIGAALFVPQTNRVTDLVDSVSFCTVGPQGNGLLASLHAHVRTAAVPTLK